MKNTGSSQTTTLEQITVMLWKNHALTTFFGQETPPNNAKETNKKAKGAGGRKKK